MKFQITIKQQAQAINGKAKLPLYKASNQKNLDDNRGIQALDELIQNSSIKIYCDQCQKQITIDTIVIAYEGQQKILLQKQSQTNNKSKIIEQQKKPIYIQQNKKDSKIKIAKPKKINSFQQQDQLFEEDDSAQYINQQSSSSQEIQNQNKQELIVQQKDNLNLDNQILQTEQQNVQINRQITHLYCVGCFACLDQIPKFYSIRKSLKFSPLNSKWRLFDQICLLNGLKFWGFSNWGQIKEFMDYNSCLFTLSEIQSHYQEVYLKINGTCFPQNYDFDINRSYKPLKQYLQQIMHNYYYPKQSEQKIRQIHQQNNLKRQKPVENYQQQKQIQINQKTNQKMKHHLPEEMSKQPKHIKVFPDLIHNSNTSLINGYQQIQQKIKSYQPKQHQQKYFESDQEQSDQEQILNFNQIQLKPKSSSKVLDEKNHIIMGKSMKQNINRSHLYLNDQNNSYQLNSENNNHTLRNQSSYSSHLLKGHNVYSYNPKRKEFQIIEYDYYAQSMLAQLQFGQEDTEQEQQLKIKIIEEYNRRLDERIKRRQFVIQHRLLDTDFILKTIKKYNKHNVQKFEPFRRLLNKNQEYFGIVDSYDSMCKAKCLSQGMIKIKRKLSSKKRILQFKDFMDYLNKKKEKKQVLGQRTKLQNEVDRKVIYRQVSRLNKKMILSMSQHSSSYANQLTGCLSQFQQGQAARTMTSRSQQRERLRNTNQNSNRQNIQISNSLQEGCQNTNSYNLGFNQKPSNYVYCNGNGLGSILSQQQVNTIQKTLKKQIEYGAFKIPDFKPVLLKNYVLKPMISIDLYEK